MGINGDQELKTSSAIKWYGQWWSEVSEGLRKPGYEKWVNDSPCAGPSFYNII